MVTNNSGVGVVLMTYGSPSAPDEVPAYLASVRGGRPAPEELVVEFQRRYRLIGGSPLLQITLDQASALEALLNGETGDADRFHVTVGMRNAPPWIPDAFRHLASRRVDRVIAVILSPQYSPIIMGGYHEAVEEARSVLGAATGIKVAGAWHLLPSFLDALATRVQQARQRLPPSEREEAAVVFTAHSMPKRVVEREPAYIDQLKKTAREVAERAGIERDRWQFAYQSAGHTPGEWLRPDVRELFPGLRAEGHRSVIVAPVQFLADHLEVLYDIDVAAAGEAWEAGIELTRIEMFNLMPEFITALADVVRREL